MASAPEVLDSISAKYSVFALERTAGQLREALLEESQALQDDREFLEVCMREETEVKLALARELSQRRAAHAAKEDGENAAGASDDEQPSLEELKSFKSKLQSTWLAMEEHPGGSQLQPRPPTPEQREGGSGSGEPPAPARRGGRLRAALAHTAASAAAIQRPSTSSGSPGRNKAGTAAGILDDLDELFG